MLQAHQCLVSLEALQYKGARVYRAVVVPHQAFHNGWVEPLPSQLPKETQKVGLEIIEEWEGTLDCTNPSPIMTEDEFAQLNIGPGLEPKEREQLSTLLHKYKGIFTLSQAELGQSNIAELVIDMGDALPVHIPPQRSNQAAREIIRNEVTQMKAAGVIQPSISAYSSPVVPFLKFMMHQICCYVIGSLPL